jgi:hypothetical protein
MPALTGCRSTGKEALIRVRGRRYQKAVLQDIVMLREFLQAKPDLKEVLEVKSSKPYRAAILNPRIRQDLASSNVPMVRRLSLSV